MFFFQCSSFLFVAKIGNMLSVCLSVLVFFDTSEWFWLNVRAITGTSFPWQLEDDLELLVAAFCVSNPFFFVLFLLGNIFEIIG